MISQLTVRRAARLGAMGQFSAKCLVPGYALLYPDECNPAASLQQAVNEQVSNLQQGAQQAINQAVQSGAGTAGWNAGAAAAAGLKKPLLYLAGALVVGPILAVVAWQLMQPPPRRHNPRRRRR